MPPIREEIKEAMDNCVISCKNAGLGCSKNFNLESDEII